jgi:hypothetical protein
MVIYPNPSDGSVPPILLIPVNTVTDVKVKIFTVAFRKVWETSVPSVGPPGSQLTLPLTDKWGTPLANGVYYVVVETDLGFYKAKWLILK